MGEADLELDAEPEEEPVGSRKAKRSWMGVSGGRSEISGCALVVENMCLARARRTCLRVFIIWVWAEKARTSSWLAAKSASNRVNISVSI